MEKIRKKKTNNLWINPHKVVLRYFICKHINYQNNIFICCLNPSADKVKWLWMMQLPLNGFCVQSCLSLTVYPVSVINIPLSFILCDFFKIIWKIKFILPLHVREGVDVCWMIKNAQLIIRVCIYQVIF